MSDHRTLRPDVRLPYLGFGTYLIPDGEARAAVSHVDTAEVYGNETGVGHGLADAMASEKLARTDLFVTTKLFPGNAAWGQVPRDTETTIAALDTSLAKLGLEYVDLYLIHAPFDPAQRLAQWRGLVALQEQGKARAIGVSNFSAKHLDEIAAAGLPAPAANQIELHPWSQKPELVKYLDDHDIVPIAYSSLVPLTTWRAAPGQASAKSAAMRSESAVSPFREMAAKHGVTEAQVLLRWAIQKGRPVLPKSTNPERIRQNADLFSFALDDADMAAIATMDRGDGVAWPSGDPTRNA